MERELAEHLLMVARAFSEATELKLSTIGRKAAFDGRFFENLSDPEKSFTARKYDEVLAWFSANWPPDAPWPPGVSKPDPAEWARIAAEAASRAAARRASAPTEAAA